ncbi:GEVED domain-containing protein [Chitinophagaceae bacterium MMS25-I14]
MVKKFTQLKAKKSGGRHNWLYLAFMLIASAGWQQSAAQYCTPSYSTGCTAQDDINSFTLTGYSGSTISDLATGCSSGGYADRTTVVAAVNVQQGGTYAGTVTTDYSSSEYYQIWIDFNNNNVFDASEAMFPSIIGPFGSASASTFNLTIPLSAATGSHRMRVRLVYAASGTIDPCTSYTYGEVHDYLVNVVAAPPCSGAPSITGVTPAGPIASCAGNTQTLTVGLPIASGYTYQWESGTSCSGPWTAIAGATNQSYTFSVTGNGFYHAVVTCTNSSQSSTSACVQVSATSPTYASIPYIQDFESWNNYCGTSDVPSSNWTNQPATGNNSWRRNDQGSTANWYSPTSGIYLSGNQYVSGSYSARFHTYGTYIGSPATQAPGNLDLYVNCSASTAAKQLYFWYNNFPYINYANDSLTVWLSTNGGSSFTQIAGYDTTTAWTRKSLPIPSSSAQTIVRFTGRRWGPYDYSDIFLDSVYIAPPCSGQPVAGTISPAGPLSGCPGSVYSLSTVGTTLAGNMTYQWIQKSNTATSWSAATGGSGANTANYTTPSLYDTIRYRMVVTCTGSGLRDTTAAIVINVAKPLYASIPYVEDFENWSNRCFTTDVPTMNWTNTPATGNSSWRRNDQGASAGWTSATTGLTTPQAAVGTYSARWHGYYATVGQPGKLDVFVDCSTVTGNKELQYFLKTQTGATYPNDSLNVLLSTDGGATFAPIELNGAGTGGWDLHVVPVVSNSATTVIRFLAKDAYQYYGDIAIDYVRILPPCAGKPTAGTMVPVTPCANADFTLKLQGNSQAAGLTYQWQQSTNGITASNVPGGAQMIATANISAPTYFRCIVTCTNSGMADTTPFYLVNLAQFYYCYCNSTAIYTGLTNIGNVSLFPYNSTAAILNNGNATPNLSNGNANNLYTDFRYTVTPPALFRDSVYKISVAQINPGSYAYAATIGAFIDLNRNGIFEPAEKVFTSATSTTTQQVADTFRISDTAQIGLTGMRVVMVYGTGVTINPCGTYSYGETEDYLVNIKYPPCNGPTNAGTAHTSDTAMCAGYSFTLIDTTHEKLRSGLIWDWQTSVNNGSTWSHVSGSGGKDTITEVFTGTSWYRLRIVCTNSGDTTYSNIVTVNIKPAYKCYCYSIATGGANDSTDIGAVSIGSFVNYTGGPHLRNGSAVHGRTDFTDYGPIELFSDSTYQLNVFHTMPGSTHADARLTVFMDFNNNLQYDIPSERIPLASDISTANGWYIINNITIPTAVVPNVPTGMRLILNNNVGPNNPSDMACGTYTSGETEDYTVIFRKSAPTGINTISGLKELGIFPNPTSGRFTVQFNSSKVYDHVMIRVSSITGEQLIVRNYTTPSSMFREDLDMGGYAKGIYYVEIMADGEKMIRKLVVR